MQEAEEENEKETKFILPQQRGWGKVISNTRNVKINNLDPIKRPVAAVADNVEIRNVKFLSIKINKKNRINLLYDKNRSLVKKIKIEQLIKNTN